MSDDGSTRDVEPGNQTRDPCWHSSSTPKCVDSLCHLCRQPTNPVLTCPRPTDPGPERVVEPRILCRWGRRTRARTGEPEQKNTRETLSKHSFYWSEINQIRELSKTRLLSASDKTQLNSLSSLLSRWLSSRSAISQLLIPHCSARCRHIRAMSNQRVDMLCWWWIDDVLGFGVDDCFSGVSDRDKVIWWL